MGTDRAAYIGEGKDDFFLGGRTMVSPLERKVDVALSIVLGGKGGPFGFF